jgi:hypothetical protein
VTRGRTASAGRPSARRRKRPERRLPSARK